MDTLILEPRFFGKNIKEHILNQLKHKVQGKCTARYGYTILVTRLLDCGAGKVHEDTGCCHFPVRYASIVYRPFKNEILHAIVTSVTEIGFHCKAGPVVIFVANAQEVMPEDLHFDQPPDGQACYISEDDSLRIEKGSKVRVRVMAVHTGGQELTVVGSIKDDYLG